MLYQTPFYLVFLGGCLLAYWLVCRTAAARFALLALASIGFLPFVAMEHTSLPIALGEILGGVGLAVLVYWVGTRLAANSGGTRVSLALALPLGILLLLKYPATRALVVGPAGLTAIPLGLSYYAFKHIHYLVESARRRVTGTTLPQYLAYIFFFPMFVAGPIERLPAFVSQTAGAKWSWDHASSGLERVLLGMGKKFLIADLLITPLLPDERLLAAGAPTLGGPEVLVAAFLQIVLVYFDFAGYTDMVLGTGRLFGIKLMENFDFPFLRADLAEFWRTWHISLSSWARDYVYFPLLGWTRSTNLAIVATMLTIGAWHGTGPGWVLWGGHHAVGLMILPRYRRWCEGRPGLQRIRSTVGWRVAATLVVWWFVAVGFALTLDPGTVGGSIKLYLKALTLGVAG